MEEVKNVPEIRFGKFTDEWNEITFENLFDGLSNNSLSREELNYNSGYIKNIHYGDIIVKFDNVIDVKSEILPLVIDNNLVLKQLKSKLNDGDIIFADAAEDTTVGKCIEVVNTENETVLSGLHTIAVRPRLDFALKYLGYYLNSKSYHNQLLKLMQGTKVLSISKTSISDTIICYPENKKEQQLIAKVFSELDSSIKNHNDQLKKLINLKKGMLFKMFPQDDDAVPEIRFKGSDEEWNESSLDEEILFFTGLTYSPSDVNSKANTLVLRSSNVKNDEIIDADNVYVDESVINCTYVKQGDIIVVVRNGSRRLIGKHAQVKKDMPNTVIGAFMTGVRAEVPSFLNALLSTQLFQKQIEENLGATINQITTGVFKKMMFKFPKTNEQEQIGSYFQNLDTLIFNHKEQLKKLNQIKKAYLSKLFVSQE